MNNLKPKNMSKEQVLKLTEYYNNTGVVNE